MLWARLVDTPPGDLYDRAERLGAYAHFAAAALGHLYTEAVGYHDAHRRDPYARRLSADEVFDSTAAALSVATQVAANTAKSHLSEAIQLSHRLPATLAALRNGQINRTTATAILDETAGLDPPECAKVENSLFPAAHEQFPAQARAAARRAVLAADPDAARRRAEQARQQRRVQHTAARDGMGWLSALLPAQTSNAIFAVIDAHARALADASTDTGTGAADARGIDERRADAFADLILNPPHRPAPQITVHLHIVATAGSLIGVCDEPAELAGHGPISADLARTLAADAVWSRILTDPAGQILDTGARQYRPSAATTRRVKSRDRHCRFPGCRRPVWAADLDHSHPHSKGGTSDHTNLAALCRYHHRVKHLPGWGLTQTTGGVLTWTTPDGHTYTTRPPPLPGHDPTDTDGTAGLEPAPF